MALSDSGKIKVYFNNSIHTVKPANREPRHPYEVPGLRELLSFRACTSMVICVVKLFKFQALD